MAVNSNPRLWVAPLLICLLLTSMIGHADSHFPPLSGRVVDQANLLGQAQERRLTALLENQEKATDNQIVIVTLPNLGGVEIETYGYRLGRHWGIGQKGEDNGVLLLVAKKERKVRIEVGYGLEGTLTDAISSNIVNRVIVPEFKKARFEAGIEQGARAIIGALGGQYQVKSDGVNGDWSFTDIVRVIFIIIFLSIVAKSFFGGGGRGGGYRSNRHYGTGSYGGGFRRGRGRSGGGFRGGGGGFGGGGASGGW